MELLGKTEILSSALESPSLDTVTGVPSLLSCGSIHVPVRTISGPWSSCRHASVWAALRQQAKGATQLPREDTARISTA